MKEVRIKIPDNCEIFQDGNTYVIKEKEQKPPRSWEEFCEKFPNKKGEAYIDTTGTIISSGKDFVGRVYRNWCTSKEEAKAFLALMQLRQLRNAWVGDWTCLKEKQYAIIRSDIKKNRIVVGFGFWAYGNALSFPTVEMAEDFLGCFGDLCETAGILL